VVLVVLGPPEVVVVLVVLVVLGFPRVLGVLGVLGAGSR
jgi:hypothetical protein